jgi:diguanylate cyclase (GGDEF)-like protein
MAARGAGRMSAGPIAALCETWTMIRLGLRRRLLLLFLAVVVLTAAMLRTVWLSMAQAEADASALLERAQVGATLERIDSGLNSAIGSQRGFLLTSQPRFLADYHQALPRLVRDQVLLADLTVHAPDQSVRAAQLRALVNQRLAQLAETLAVHERLGRDSALALLLGEDRLAVDAQLRALSEQMALDEGRRLAGQQARSADSRSDSQRLALGAVVLVALLLTLAFALVLREQRRRRGAEDELRRGSAQLAESLEEMQLLARDLRALTELGAELQASRRSSEALAAARQAGLDLLADAAGQVLLYGPDGDRLELVGSWGEPALRSDHAFAAEACWALRRSQVHAVDHPQATRICDHVRAEDLAAAAYLCLPLVAHGQGLGLLHLNRWRPFDERERQLAAGIAEQLSMALANLSLQESLRAEAIRDPLTGLFNRRFMDASLARELDRARRQDAPLAVLMFDLDHFKHYNDQHGHDGGDALLAEFGVLLARLSRTGDIACRYGGEEFTLIMVGAGAEEGCARAEAIRSGLAALAPRVAARTLPSTTASIGVAVYPAHGGSSAELLSRADAALYAAKRSGRDRVVLAAA